MTTKATLFLNMKNETVARPLGLRRFRRAPGCGQCFEIAVDGRPVRVRITRSSPVAGGASGSSVADVHAEEV